MKLGKYFSYDIVQKRSEATIKLMFVENNFHLIILEDTFIWK